MFVLVPTGRAKQSTNAVTFFFKTKESHSVRLDIWKEKNEKRHAENVRMNAFICVELDEVRLDFHSRKICL